LIEQQPPTPSSVNHPVGSGYFREIRELGDVAGFAAREPA